MTPDEARRLIAGSGNPQRAAAMLRSRARRERRQLARKEGLSVAGLKNEQFKAAVEQSFQMVQQRVVPRVLKVKDG